MNITSTAQRDENHALIDIPKPIFDLVHRMIQAMRLNSGILTYDVLGYDVERNLAAVLFQHKYVTEEKRLRVRHVYTLIGVDDGKVFGDFIRIIPPRIPHIDEMPPEKVVKWAESDLFQVPISELDKIIYQGNLALIPTRIIPDDGISKITSLPIYDDRYVRSVTLDNSYRVSVRGGLYENTFGFFVDGTIEVVHTKGQYDTVRTKGLYKVVVVHHPESPEWIRDVLLTIRPRMMRSHFLRL
jgi:hypothetical protein